MTCSPSLCISQLEARQCEGCHFGILGFQIFFEVSSGLSVNVQSYIFDCDLSINGGATGKYSFPMTSVLSAGKTMIRKFVREV